MRREMRRQRIKRPLDQIFIANIGWSRVETRKPRRALPVVGEQAVDISADHPAVGGDRALGRTVGEPRERPRAILPFGHAHVHLIAGKRHAIAGRSGHGFEALVVRQRGCDVEKAEALDRRRRAFNAAGIGDRVPEHLIAAAQPEHHSAASPMRGDVDMEPGGAQRLKIGDGRLRTGQQNQVGVAGQRYSRPDANELDSRLGIERIEIVEIGDVRQDRHRDAQARVGLCRPRGIERQRVLRRQ